MTPAALPWRTDLFTGRAVLVAGPAGPFGPAAAKTWRALGGQAIESPGGHAPAADEQVASAWATAGTLDTLVVLASEVPEDPEHFDPGFWREGVEAGLSHAWYLMQAGARQWRDRGHPGSIVVLMPPYREMQPRCQLRRAVGASLAHLLKTVAVEWAAHAVRVNGIAPHDADTVAVTDAVVWLSAPSGKFVTGEVMNLGAQT